MKVGGVQGAAVAPGARRASGIGLRLFSIAGLLGVSAAAFSLVPSSGASTSHTALPVLTAGTGFSVTGAITAGYPACSGSVDLYPGVADCLTYTVTNPSSVAIIVTSLGVSVDASTLPAGCPASLLDLDLTDAAYSGTPTLSVPAGQSSSVSEPIEMTDNGNQDGCAGAAFAMDYSGSASYTDATTTVLSAPNPSALGSSATFTATVTGADADTDTSVPSGIVSFYSCPSAATCAANSSNLLGSGTLNGSSPDTATFTTTATAIGTRYVEAIYQGSGTDYAASPASGVVAAVTTAALATGSGSTTTTTPTTVAPATSTSTGGLAFTGAQVTELVAGALALIAAGLLALGLARRRTRKVTL